MPDPMQYYRIAERFHQSGVLLQNDIQEASGFAAYHAYESIGSAWIRRRGQNVPWKHQKKIDQFVFLSRGYSFGYGASYIGMLQNAFRNQMLYPYQDDDGSYKLPENRISASEARDLLRRVHGLIREVAKYL